MQSDQASKLIWEAKYTRRNLYVCKFANLRKIRHFQVYEV